ncbi:ABC transporter permease [Pseudonocardia tropica]|uniref:ABC transporter permease n=1 Tax=Pseudonocardia tropica TaxID=681289 RepID=A0ABV1JZ74_9PSEU
MGSVVAELLKLRRSHSWAVVVALPLMAVFTGTATTLASGRPLDDGWQTLWLRVVVFHGLVPQAVGLAALGSLVWRVEHRPGNWDALTGRGVGGREIVLGKLAALSVLAAVMQVFLLLGTAVAGTLVFDLPGLPPLRHVLVTAVVVVACIPVLALQSALSMRMRSFAAPVAIALVGAVVSVGVLLAGTGAFLVAVPYALLARATQLGTGVVADDGTITAGTVLGIVAAAVVTTAVLVETTARLLERGDLHQGVRSGSRGPG